MIKEQVVAILQAKKDEQVAAVAAVYDGLIAQVNGLQEDSNEQIAALQAQVADLQAQLADAQGKLSQANDLAKQIDAVIPD